MPDQSQAKPMRQVSANPRVPLATQFRLANVGATSVRIVGGGRLAQGLSEYLGRLGVAVRCVDRHDAAGFATLSVVIAALEATTYGEFQNVGD